MARGKVQDGRKTALITGCSPGGIGYALARSFQRRGFRVFATGRSEATLSAITADGLEPIELDVTSISSIRAARDSVKQKLASSGQGLNYLINNAGQGFAMPAIDSDPDETAHIFATNAVSVVNMCREFSNVLIDTAATNEPATIANISSVAGYLPYVFGGVYAATKGAVRIFSDSLRPELKPFGVHVVEIVTGGVISNIVRKPGRPLPKGSQYEPIDDAYQMRQGLFQSYSTPTHIYAERVVSQLLAMEGLDADSSIGPPPVDSGSNKQVLAQIFSKIQLVQSLVAQVGYWTGLNFLLGYLVTPFWLLLTTGSFNPKKGRLRRNKIWEGREAGTVWWMNTLHLHTMVEQTLAKRFGLMRLAPARKQA